MPLYNLKITTATGSTYTFNERGICVKHDSEGRGIDAFKLYSVKALPDEVSSLQEIYDLSESAPEVGKRLYVGGKDGWWISTPVVSIEPLN